MSGNPTLSPFLGWNKLHGGSMGRNSSQEMGQSGEADRRSRVLQLALRTKEKAFFHAMPLRAQKNVCEGNLL